MSCVYMCICESEIKIVFSQVGDRSLMDDHSFCLLEEECQGLDQKPEILEGIHRSVGMNSRKLENLFKSCS